MAFQIKDFVSITASMLNWMRSTQKRITDFNVGSGVRTMLEASAIEIDELYQQMFIGLKEAIPVSVYNSFDFAALPAVPAGGIITVTIQSSTTPVVVTAGTVFTPASGGVTYSAIQDVTFQPGITMAGVAVSASAAGVIGNIAASTTFTANPTPTGFVSAINEAPFISGSDAESPEDRKNRFRDYISTLSRGTVASIVFGLKTVFLLDSVGNKKERVVFANAVEPYKLNPMNPRGLVNTYIHNGIGGTSNDLINEAKKIIDGYVDQANKKIAGYKPAGTEVTIVAATEVPVDFTAEIEAIDGFDVDMLCDQATDQIGAYILSLDINTPFLFSEAVRIIKTITGVYNVIVSVPDNIDIQSGMDEKLMPGDIEITPAA